MKSHHGTHLRKPGETVSRMLTPETPTQLTEGDIITFGKSVESHTGLVRPVVARVELRYRHPDPGLKPLNTPNRPAIRVDLTKGSPKSSSGRYGLYVSLSSSSSSSDDDSSVLSDNDSDIEEIPVSGANALPLQPRGSNSAEAGSNLTRAFEVFKKLMPPVYVAPKEHQQNEVNDSHTFYLPPLDLSEENYPDSPIYSPYSPRSISPMFDLPGLQHVSDEPPYVLPLVDERSASSKSLHPIDLYTTSPFHNRVTSECSESDARSKSSSPMDLASSPPFSHDPSPIPERANEPSIIGAYPKSRSSSPSASSAICPAPATHVESVDVSEKAKDGQADAEGDAVVDLDHVEEEEEADADADAETDDEGAEAEDANAEVTGAHHLPAVSQALDTPGLDQAEKNVASAGLNSWAPEVSDALTSDVSKLRIGLTELQVC